jgi:hypothetical protein
MNIHPHPRPPSPHLTHLLGREQRAGSGGDDTSLAQLLLPETRVEFRIDGLDLPGILATLAVGCLQDVNTLDAWGTRAESGAPSECDGVTGNGFDGENLKADGGLATLTSLKGGLAGEGDAANGI